VASTRLRTVLFALCLTALVGAGSAAAAPRTTEPASLTQVKVSITDKAVSIARDRFTKGSLTRYPRGAIIDFLITNRGTKPYKAELQLTGKYSFSKYERKVTSVRSALIQPGRKAHLQVNFYFRSKFSLLALLDGKTPGPHTPILIF
jgi:hypothetical protein